MTDRDWGREGHAARVTRVESDAASLHAADRREEDDAPAFRVIDRRRFAPDGSERGEDEEPSQASTSPGEQPAREERPAPGEGRSSTAAGLGDTSAGPELAMPKGAPYDQPSDLPEPTFATLLISLSTQALMYLGEIPDLEGGEARKDLGAARNIIDLLAVLERKTAGNLDADEAALLERILYDLRMRFVAISRG
jgi:hypothetical protein